MRIAVIGFFLVVLVFSLCVHTVVARDDDEKWKKLNLNDLEKQFQNGDESEELESEWDRMQRVIQKKSPKYDTNDPDSIKKAYDENPSAFGGSGGGSMIFAQLNPNNADGTPRSEADQNTVAAKYNSLLRTGGLIVEIYNTEKDVLLFNVNRGWQTNDVMRFIAMQPEVEHFTLNSKQYKPSEYLREDGDDDDDEL
mmetsp:Transcript_1794/g.2876  ORF Transcript_1794/g.2876 Transcript_1794/m.2876 type:complete len:196 (-) Transcript_1794:639-1226(-)